MHEQTNPLDPSIAMGSAADEIKGVVGCSSSLRDSDLLVVFYRFLSTQTTMKLLQMLFTWT